MIVEVLVDSKAVRTSSVSGRAAGLETAGSTGLS